jgi:hypothetical protein
MSDEFWTTNIYCFKKLGGCIIETDKKFNNFTPNEILEENITRLNFNRVFNHKNINKMKDIISNITSSGNINYNSPKKLKSNLNLPRAISKNLFSKFISLLPQKTAPPKHFLNLNDEESTENIYQVLSDNESESNSDNVFLVKRYKLDSESSTYKLESSPPKLLKRSSWWQKTEIIPKRLNSTHLEIDTNSKFKPIQLSSKNLIYKIGSEELSISKIKQSQIYKAIIKKGISTHVHSTIYSDMQNIQPNWALLPNQKLFPTLPKKVFDLRYKIMHNRLYIGRKVIHNDHYEMGNELCPICNIEQTTLHLFLNCPLTLSLWHSLNEYWNQLIGSFEDFIDQKYHLITDSEKLFGIESPSSEIGKNNILTQQLKDVFIGFLQKFIYEAINKYLFEKIMPNEIEITKKWKYYLALSTNTIINRMKSNVKIYQSNWYFQ